MAKASSGRRGVQALKTTSAALVNAAELRHAMIAEAAYYRWQGRADAGQPTDDLQDWLEAEKAIDSTLALGREPDHQHGRSSRD